jgi:hypothetical protein
MSALQSPSAIWIIAVVQVLGLASAWLARLSEGSRRQTSCQWLFFACLMLVGAATIVALHFGPGFWLTAGGTLSVMVLGATCDFTPAARPNVWKHDWTAVKE